MRFDVLTLFPEMFPGYLGQSLLKLAIQNGLVEIHLWNIRDWAKGKHHSVDDRPFGGGPGMVMMPEPVFDCVEHVRRQAGTGVVADADADRTAVGPAPGERAIVPPAACVIVRPVRGV